MATIYEGTHSEMLFGSFQQEGPFALLCLKGRWTIIKGSFAFINHSVMINRRSWKVLEKCVAVKSTSQLIYSWRTNRSIHHLC